MNAVKSVSTHAYQPIVPQPIEFSAYSNQMIPIMSDELVKKDHFIARLKKARAECIVEVIIYSGTRWVPCGFHRFEYENDALYWVDAINKIVDKDKMISGLFIR
jgi:intergrase/recombinase